MMSVQRVLCLDWDRRNLRVVSARVGRGKFKLAEAHSRRIPNNVDADDPPALGGFIAQTLASLRIRGRRVIVDIPRDKAVINRLKLAPTPPSEVAAAVRFQALRELPYPVDQAAIDFDILERDANRNVVEVLLAAVRNETMTRLRETCDAAGLSLVRVGLRPYANLISVLNLPAMIDRRVLFVDVGPSNTEINVFRGEVLAFTRAAGVSVPFAAGELVSDDSRVSSKAELSAIERAEVVENAAVEDLVVEMQRSLQAYRATETNATIDQIVIAGSTGVETALLSAVDEKFGLPTMLFDPTLSLGEAAAEATKLRGFSAALGLAWGCCQPDRVSIDFLNPKKPVARKETIRKRAQAAGIAAAALVALGVGGATWDYYRLSNQLGTLKSQNQPIGRDANEKRVIEVRVDSAADWQQRARMQVWPDHLLRITKAAAEFAPDARPEEATKKLLLTGMTCDGVNGLITMRLVCDDEQTASAFKKKLLDYKDAKGKSIYDVELGKWTQTRIGDTNFKGSVQLTLRIQDIARFDDGKTRKQRERDLLKKADEFKAFAGAGQ